MGGQRGIMGAKSGKGKSGNMSRGLMSTDSRVRIDCGAVRGMAGESSREKDRTAVIEQQ